MSTHVGVGGCRQGALVSVPEEKKKRCEIGHDIGLQAPISIELEWSRSYRAYHCARRGWGGVEPRTAREPVKNDVEGNVLHEGLVGDGDVVALERPAPGSQRPAGRVPPGVDCGSRLSVLMNLSSVWMSGGYDETRVRRWSFF